MAYLKASTEHLSRLKDSDYLKFIEIYSLASLDEYGKWDQPIFSRLRVGALICNNCVNDLIQDYTFPHH